MPKRRSPPTFAIWPWIFAPAERKIRCNHRSQKRGQKQGKEGANPEMDQIAKLVSGRLKAQSAGPHPGPDLLAAFAENALQNEEREKLLEHVGACSDCRQILYLSLPESAEAQRILALKPNRRPALALGWGALVGSLTILVVVLTIRYQSHGPAMQKGCSKPSP